MNEQQSNERKHSEEGSSKYCSCFDAVCRGQLQLVVDVVEYEAAQNGAENVAESHYSERPWHGCRVTVEQSLHMHDRCANQWCAYALYIAWTTVMYGKDKSSLTVIVDL